ELVFFFQAEDGIRDATVTGVQTCALPILEHLENPAAVLDRLAVTLKPGGAIVMLVPNVPALFGTLDRSLGHQRRYSAATARQLRSEERRVGQGCTQGRTPRRYVMT